MVNWTSSGESIRVVDSLPLKFYVGISFNSTYASSSSEAISFTRVYMNISDSGSIWVNEELNNTSCVLSGDYYYLEELAAWNQTGKPESGITYAFSTRYEGYY
jgi:hypothetical protein